MSKGWYRESSAVVAFECKDGEAFLDALGRVLFACSELSSAAVDPITFLFAVIVVGL